MDWFLSPDNKLPRLLTDRIRLEFTKPDASQPATKAEIRSLQLMLLTLAVIDETQLAELERKVSSFDPVTFLNREPGRRSMQVEIEGGKTCTVTTLVEPFDGTTMVSRKARLDRHDELLHELEATLTRLQQATSGFNRRIAALEHTIKEQQ